MDNWLIFSYWTFLENRSKFFDGPEKEVDQKTIFIHLCRDTFPFWVFCFGCTQKLSIFCQVKVSPKKKFFQQKASIFFFLFLSFFEKKEIFLHKKPSD